MDFLDNAPGYRPMPLMQLAAAVAAAFAGLRWSPAVTLQRDVVRLSQPPAVVLSVQRERFWADTADLLAAEEDRD